MNIAGKKFVENVRMLRKNPAALRGWLPHLKNYKMTVREIAKYLLSIFGGTRPPEMMPRLIALAWHYYLADHGGEVQEKDDYKTFLVMLEIDVVEVMETVVNNYMTNLKVKSNLKVKK